MRLQASYSREDERRAARLLIAWVTGDKFACRAVLEAAMQEPDGAPGLLFALTDMAARLGEELAGHDFVHQLRRALLYDANEPHGHDTE